MPAPMSEMPYLHVVDMPRMMAGKGAPRSTVFGVLGRTKESGGMRILGGLVKDAPPSAPLPKGHLMEHPRGHTERNIIGPAAKTHIAKTHYGQIPYAGKFYGPAGEKV